MGKKFQKKIKINTISTIYELDDIETTYYDGYDRTFMQNYNFRILNDEVEIIEEEKKIPEKLDIKIQNETTGNAYITNEQGTKCYLTKHSKIIAERLNQVIDYLKSKGEQI